MESLFLIKCHRIIDQQQERVAVVTVDSFQIDMASADSIKQEQLKIPMFVTSGENDTLKDNGINNINRWCISSNRGNQRNDKRYSSSK